MRVDITWDNLYIYYTMENKNKRIMWIVGIVVVLGLIGSTMKNEEPTDTPTIATEAVKETQYPDRTQAYVIAKQFAQRKLGSADFGWGDDGFQDYGNGNYMVTGVADIPGKRYRWTVEIQYNGGDWSTIDNWTLKGYTDL